MSARRRTRGPDSVKPPRIDKPAESGDTLDERTAGPGDRPARGGGGGVVWTLCGGLKYLMLLVIVPPFINYAALQRENTELKPTSGELYDVGWGRKMFLQCSGKGPPTVILDAPTGTTSDVWSLVRPKIEKHARVCVYDRAGLGFSERPVQNVTTPLAATAADADATAADTTQHARGQPFTAESMTEDLYRLITSSSQQPQPFIFVGAELGALVSQFYTLMFDRDVLGLVLLNPLPETLFDSDTYTWSHYWFGQLVPTYQSLQLAAALGLTRVGLLLGILKQPLPAAHLDPTVVNRQNYLMCHPRHLSSVVDEHHFINDTFSQMRTLRMMRGLPSNVSVTVMTGNYYDEQLPSSLNKAWAKAQQDLITRAFPGAQHIVVNAADRHMPLTAPDAVVEQVLKLVRHWRLRQPVSAPK
ncbi:uncharacterized protein LOC143276788 [Babylonia areolata]|uniref:uncharacterized protein LOC143276788 n=1 Tax=Babylonia areolata TaxID=304850 RepID=UPI003FD20D79